MDDRELADKVVALGTGRRRNGMTIKHGHTKFYVIGAENLISEAFVRDWRVAGALMERCGGSYGRGKDGAFCEAWGSGAEPIEVFDESLPRAIIEACVQALSTEETK